LKREPEIKKVWVDPWFDARQLRLDFTEDLHFAVEVEPPYGLVQVAFALERLAYNLRHAEARGNVANQDL
jgi:hypothetical protein